MQRYENYYDSGIEWIGEIPERWKSSLIKYSLDSIISGGTPSTDNDMYWAYNHEEGSIPWVSIADITESKGKLYKTEKNITIEGLKAKSLKIIPKETLLLSIFASLGKTTILKIDATINQAILGLVSFSKLNKDFLKYYLIFIERYVTYYSSSNTQDNLNLYKIKNLPIVYPEDISEQIKIANYLNKKTKEIDTLIEQKEQLLELYEEERKAIINQAITKGIVPNAKMKDSGIEWIGEIPERWEVKKLKYVIQSLNNVRVPLSSDIRGKMIEKRYDYYGASGIIDKVEEYLFDEPLLLIGEDGANLLDRNSRLVFIAKGKYWVNNHAHILKPTFGILEYYCELLELYDFTIWVTGSAQPKLTSENLMNINILVPPISEQKKIVDYIEEKISIIDQKVEKTKKIITLYKEYKTALISEVVTGKIKVPEELI